MADLEVQWRNDGSVLRVYGAADQKHILTHEAVEHMLMRDFKWDYNRAHDAANAVEALERRRAARRG